MGVYIHAVAILESLEEYGASNLMILWVHKYFCTSTLAKTSLLARIPEVLSGPETRV
jgi:hypothetical protein